MASEIINFLIENRIELKRMTYPHLKKTLINKDMFLPFEFKDRIKESVNYVINRQIMDTFNLNTEEGMLILSDDSVKNAMENLFYDPIQYSDIK